MFRLCSGRFLKGRNNNKTSGRVRVFVCARVGGQTEPGEGKREERKNKKKKPSSSSPASIAVFREHHQTHFGNTETQKKSWASERDGNITSQTLRSRARSLTVAKGSALTHKKCDTPKRRRSRNAICRLINVTGIRDDQKWSCPGWLAGAKQVTENAIFRRANGKAVKRPQLNKKTEEEEK